MDALLDLVLHVGAPGGRLSLGWKRFNVLLAFVRVVDHPSGLLDALARHPCPFPHRGHFAFIPIRSDAFIYRPCAADDQSIYTTQ
jgi:hypothetical protein